MIQIVVHAPQSPERRQELAERVGRLHAQTAAEMIRALSCPDSQKAALVEAVLEAHGR